MSVLEANGGGRTANATANGEMVAADTTKGIRLLGWVVTSTIAGTVKFTDGSSDLVPPFSIPANSPFVVPFNPCGWATTAANKAVVLSVSGGGTIAVTLSYQKISV